MEILTPPLGSLLSLTLPPNACLSSFMIETAFRISFVFFNPMLRLTFLIGSKRSAHSQTKNASHLQLCMS